MCAAAISDTIYESTLTNQIEEIYYRPTTCSQRLLKIVLISLAITYLYGRYISDALRGKWRKRQQKFNKPDNLNKHTEEQQEEDKLNVQSRFSSSVNSVIVFSLSLLAFYVDGTRLRQNPLHVHSKALTLCQCCLFAYSIVDFGVVLLLLIGEPKTRLENLCFLIHHVSTLYLTGVVAIYDYLPFFAAIRCLSEFSTPLLNIRWFALKLGYYGTTRFRLLQTTLLVSFLACRLVPIFPFWIWIVHTAYLRPLPPSGWRILDCLVNVVHSPANYVVNASHMRATLNIANQKGQSDAGGEQDSGRTFIYQPYMKPHFEIMATCCLLLDILNCMWALKLVQITAQCWKKKSRGDDEKRKLLKKYKKHL